MSENNYQLIDDPNYLLIKEAFEKATKEVMKGEFLNKDGGEKLDPMSRMMMSLSGIVFVKEVEKMVFEELGIERDK